MARPPKACVLDRLLSLMNIIRQANIYQNSALSHQIRQSSVGSTFKPFQIMWNSSFFLIHMTISKSQSCEVPHFNPFTWQFSPPFMWISSSQALHMTLLFFKSCDIIPNRHLTWTRFKISHVKEQVKGLSHESPFKNVMCIHQNSQIHMKPHLKTSCESSQTYLVTWCLKPNVMWIKKSLSFHMTSRAQPSP